MCEFYGMWITFQLKKTQFQGSVIKQKKPPKSIRIFILEKLIIKLLYIFMKISKTLLFYYHYLLL